MFIELVLSRTIYYPAIYCEVTYDSVWSLILAFLTNLNFESAVSSSYLFELFARVMIGDDIGCKLCCSMAAFLNELFVAVLMTYFIGADGQPPPPLLMLLLLIFS